MWQNFWRNLAKYFSVCLGHAIRVYGFMQEQWKCSTRRNKNDRKRKNLFATKSIKNIKEYIFFQHITQNARLAL